VDRDAITGVDTCEDLEPIVDESRPTARARSLRMPGVLAGLLAIGGLLFFWALSLRESASPAACNEGDLYDAANANAIVSMPAATARSRVATLVDELRTPTVEDVVVVDADGGPGGPLEAHVRLWGGLHNDAVAHYTAAIARLDSFDAVRAGACPLTD
jgi:hypothetical protein